MEQAGVSPQDIDYVVFATMTPDHYFPAVAASCKISPGCGEHTGARHSAAVQWFCCTRCKSRTRCSKPSLAKTLLLVGAETHSPFMPFSDWPTILGLADNSPTDEQRALHTQVRDRAVLFGDAGAAIVLQREEDETERGLIDFELHADGSGYNKLYVPSGMAHRPYVSPDMIQRLDHVPHMDGKYVFRMAVTKMPEVVRSLLGKHGLTVDQIDHFIFHQANLGLTKRSSSRSESDRTASITTSRSTATTTAATISDCLSDECRRSGRIKRGDLLCFVGPWRGLPLGRRPASRLDPSYDTAPDRAPAVSSDSSNARRRAADLHPDQRGSLLQTAPCAEGLSGLLWHRSTSCPIESCPSHPRSHR